MTEIQGTPQGTPDSKGHQGTRSPGFTNQHQYGSNSRGQGVPRILGTDTPTPRRGVLESLGLDLGLARHALQLVNGRAS